MLWLIIGVQLYNTDTCLNAIKSSIQLQYIMVLQYTKLQYIKVHHVFPA